jgi:hypothetical protein
MLTEAAVQHTLDRMSHNLGLLCVEGVQALHEHDPPLTSVINNWADRYCDGGYGRYAKRVFLDGAYISYAAHNLSPGRPAPGKLGWFLEYPGSLAHQQFRDTETWDHRKLVASFYAGWVQDPISRTFVYEARKRYHTGHRPELAPWPSEHGNPLHGCLDAGIGSIAMVAAYATNMAGYRRGSSRN